MAIIKIRRWNWTEHIPRGKDVNDCFTALGWTPEGRRVRGRPRTVEEERKKGEVEGLGSSQSGGTEQKVLIRKRDGPMRLLARRDFMMMMMTVLALGFIHLREEI